MIGCFKNIILTTIGLVLIFSASGQQLQDLQVSQDKRYLETTDGEPFFWLGGTAWELIHRCSREEVDYYLKDRASKGFTVIQTVILAELDGLNTPNVYGEKPLINNDPTKINKKYFEHVDYVIKKAEELGIYIGLLPTWGDEFNLKWGVGPVVFNAENAKKYGEILAKRYLKQSNIIWILGGDRIPENNEQLEIVRNMAHGIRNVDQTHLITYHPMGAKKATDVVNEDWLDFDMFQTGHDRKSKDYQFVKSSLDIQPKRPTINGEPRYENIPDRFWEGEEREWLNDSDIRTTAYWTILAGAAGYTYGCNDIWQMYQAGRLASVKARTDWKVAVHLPGSKQLQYMKEFFTSFEWQALVNDQSAILNKNPETEEYQICAIGKDQNMMIAYTPWGRSLKLDLSKLSAQRLSAFWFNPRTGVSFKIDNYTNIDQPTFTPWSTGRGSDFVLIILEENSDISLPNLVKK